MVGDTNKENALGQPRTAQLAPRHAAFGYRRSATLCLIKTNQTGPGSHVCNCGYMVALQAWGKGLSTSMCKHSQEVAKELDYKAMQFNFVAASNKGAVRLWAKLGFETVGKLPKAFNHPAKGYIDAYVMYKWL